jgi:hypothetical protein
MSFGTNREPHPCPYQAPDLVQSSSVLSGVPDSPGPGRSLRNDFWGSKIAPKTLFGPQNTLNSLIPFYLPWSDPMLRSTIASTSGPFPGSCGRAFAATAVYWGSWRAVPGERCKNIPQPGWEGKLA